jgi:mannitol-1-/sugar-/sorbitol-6-phosphatase
MAKCTFACDAILFDLDGVLVDSERCGERILRQWCERHGLDAEYASRISHGRRIDETVALVAPHLDAKTEIAYLVGCESRETEGVFEVPGARELLAAIPRTSWAVVTSSARPVAELRIRFTSLPDPPVFITAEDVTVGKPDPQPYLAAARRLGVSPERCVVVEDAPYGIEAARRGGMRSIGLPGIYGSDTVAKADCVAPALASLRVRVVDGALEVSVQAE